MHTLSIPQAVVDRVVARRGREHVHEVLDPARTALVVVDMQNAFMLPGSPTRFARWPRRSCPTSIGSPRPCA